MTETTADAVEVETTDDAKGAAGTEGELTADQFFIHSRTEQQAIEQAMADLSAGTEQVHEVLDALLLRVQALEAAFMRSAHLLPRHDLGRQTTALKALTAAIGARREELAPRKKFSFKKREPSAKAAAKAASGYAEPSAPTAVDAKSVAAPYDGELFEGLKETSVVKGAGELAGRDVTLKALEGCRVLLLDHIGALHCHGLRRCEVIVGAIESSALMYDCRECVIILAAKQLRLHDSECISLHLHTLSNPVIEHSRRIAVSPYDLVYPEVERHWTSAALGAPLHLADSASSSASVAGLWSEMQDFNWHKRQASPNWCILPPSLRSARRECTDAASLAAAEPPPPRLEELEKCLVAWEAAEAGDAAAAASADVV